MVDVNGQRRSYYKDKCLASALVSSTSESEHDMNRTIIKIGTIIRNKSVSEEFTLVGDKVEDYLVVLMYIDIIT